MKFETQMSISSAISLAFLTVLGVVTVKYFYNPESALIGLQILCFGWVVTKIIGEGLFSIVWLLFRYMVEKYKETVDAMNDEKESKDEDMKE